MTLAPVLLKENTREGIASYHYRQCCHQSMQEGAAVDMALDLLWEMTHQDIGKDTITYTAAISACEKGQQWTLALDLLGEMTHDGIDKDTSTYTAAISACEMGQQWTLALGHPSCPSTVEWAFAFRSREVLTWPNFFAPHTVPGLFPRLVPALGTP